MSNLTKGTQAAATMMAWWVPVAVAGVAVVAVISYIRSEETHAASGSPLYGKAVKEAIEGLKNPGAKAVVARPPLAAGLSPDDYYWCEQCKAYHKRQPGQVPPVAGATPPPVAGGIPAPQAVPPAVQPGGQAVEAIPPLPAGLDPAEHYWCPNCKTYHKRQPAQGQPGSAVPPPVAGDNPATPAAAQPAGVIPPLPAGLAAADYYWCANCKTYHKRESAQPNPGAWRGVPYKLNPPPASPATVPATPSAPVSPAAPVAPTTPATPVIPAPPAAPVIPATPVAPGTAPPAAPPIVPPASATSGK